MAEKQSSSKSIQSKVGLDDIADLATEFLKPEKVVAQLQKGTATLTNLANEFLTPEKLKSYIKDYKSGLIVASLWLSRSLFSVLPIIPSITALPTILVLIVFISQTTSTRTIIGLAKHAYAEISSSVTSFGKKMLPSWMTRFIFIVLLFPITRAVTLLVMLAAWEITSKYRDGVVAVTKDADQAICRADSAAEKGDEHLREAKLLERHAMQLAVSAMHNEKMWKAVVAVARELKTEVVGIENDLRLFPTKVDKVRKLAERVKVVAEEGDLELAREMAVNVGRLEEMVMQVGKKAGERADEVERLNRRLWNLTVGEAPG